MNVPRVFRWLQTFVCAALLITLTGCVSSSGGSGYYPIDGYGHYIHPSRVPRSSGYHRQGAWASSPPMVHEHAPRWGRHQKNGSKPHYRPYTGQDSPRPAHRGHYGSGFSTGLDAGSGSNTQGFKTPAHSGYRNGGYHSRPGGSRPSYGHRRR